MDAQMVKEHIEHMRKRMIITYIIMTMIMIFITFGMTIYYELRIRAVTGAVYRQEQSASKVLIKELFKLEIGKDNLDAATSAIKYAGYTENGFEYLFAAGGHNIIMIAVSVYAVRDYINISKKYTYPIMIKLSEENEELKEKLLTNVKYVEKRNKQLQDFIENVAHQVKTPLTALGMAIDMDAGREECFFHIDRIKAFIQRLMNISRMESGKVIFAREDIMVCHMLEEAVLASGVDKDKVEILCKEPDYCVNGDRGWLKECFINIISNSAEYIKDREDGRIVISADCREDKCVIVIEDNGPGFARENTDSIFERFESDKDAGAFHVGIGLNLAKLIVEAHHGVIHAGNAYEHQGARFRVVLPKYNLKKKNVEL